MLSQWVDGFVEVFTLNGLLLMSIGVIVGIIFGACPGLTTSMGIILMLPITYSMSITQALIHG